MDRSLFRRTAIDWGAQQAPSLAVPPTRLAPIRASLSVRQQTTAPAGASDHPAYLAAPTAHRPPPEVHYDTRAKSVVPVAHVPHTWREAIMSAAPAPIAQDQAARPSSAAQTQHHMPAPPKGGLSRPVAAPTSQMSQATAATPAVVRQVSAQQAVAGPAPAPQFAQAKQWHVPGRLDTQSATPAQRMHGGTRVKQSGAVPQQHHDYVQAALSGAHGAPIESGGSGSSYAEPAAKLRLRRRIVRSVAWASAMVGVFTLSFGITVAPAYFNGRFQQPAEAETAQATADPDLLQGQGTDTGTALRVIGTGNTLQGTASQSGGDFPQGYKQMQTMYKSVALTVQIQNLPTSYNGDPTNVKVAADNLRLQTAPVQTAQWGTAYIADAGSVQLVLLANKQYLVVIQAQGHLNTDEWKDFLETFDAS